MAIVHTCLRSSEPGVSREDYERFEREVDYAVAGRLNTIVGYRTHRITATDARLAGGPWNYSSASRSPTAPPTRRSWARWGRR